MTSRTTACLLAAGAVLRPPGAAPSDPPPCVAVTEIMYDPAAVPDAGGEWFEITNFSLDQDYDLDGWTFSDSTGGQSFTLEGSYPLPAGAFMLLARSGDPETNGGVVPDVVYGPALPLANPGDTILIRDQHGAAVDRVRYAGDWAPPGAAAACEVGQHVLNDDPGRWYAATTPYGAGDLGTPGGPNETYMAGPCAADVGVIDTAPAGAWAIEPPAPNPGAPPFRFAFELRRPGAVRVTVHDVTGRTIRVLEAGRLASGRHVRSWRGDRTDSRRVASGVYWIRIEAGGRTVALPVALRR